MTINGMEGESLCDLFLGCSLEGIHDFAEVDHDRYNRHIHFKSPGSLFLMLCPIGCRFDNP
jgi:hypothetical protein